MAPDLVVSDLRVIARIEFTVLGSLGEDPDLVD